MFLRGGARAGRWLPPFLDVPGVSRGCWHRGFLHAGLSDITASILLHEIIDVVENILEAYAALSRRGGAHASRHDGEGPGRHRVTYPLDLPGRGRIYYMRWFM